VRSIALGQTSAGPVAVSADGTRPSPLGLIDLVGLRVVRRNDVLAGTPGIDSLFGGDGDDELFGAEGDDSGGSGRYAVAVRLPRRSIRRSARTRAMTPARPSRSSPAYNALISVKIASAAACCWSRVGSSMAS